MTIDKNINSFIVELMNKYTSSYDVYRDEELEGLSLPFIAFYRRRDERYMITKKIKVYGVDNQQVVYAAIPKEPVNTHFLKRFHNAINNSIDQYVPKHREHMSTILVGLIITNQKIQPEILKEVRRFRKIQFLKYGLHGWTETYLAIINPQDKLLQIHPKGKVFVSTIEKMLEEERISR